MFIVTRKNPKYTWSTMFFTKGTTHGNEWCNQKAWTKKMSKAQAIMISAVAKRYK